MKCEYHLFLNLQYGDLIVFGERKHPEQQHIIMSLGGNIGISIHGSLEKPKIKTISDRKDLLMIKRIIHTEENLEKLKCVELKDIMRTNYFSSSELISDIYSRMGIDIPNSVIGLVQLPTSYVRVH